MERKPDELSVNRVGRKWIAVTLHKKIAAKTFKGFLRKLK